MFANIEDMEESFFTQFALIKPAHEALRACALRALGLLLADGDPTVGVGDVCFFLTMRCFNDAMFSNS